MNEKLNHFASLASIDVSSKIEKKNNLSYLSWSWAVDTLMRHDASANWEFHEPKMFGESMMVSCTVTAFGKAINMHLPVMDHRNQAIKNPDACQVNKAMMRCLTKAIACHGIGLYIYSGEDLPSDDIPAKIEKAPVKPLSPDQVIQIQELAQEVGFDINLVIKAYGAISLEEIDSKHYQAILTGLEKKRK